MQISDKPKPQTTDSPEFNICQRVHSNGNTHRIGTVKYVGPVDGYSGNWIGVDWDNEDGKHDGSLNGFRYFTSRSSKSASFVRPHNLSAGISLLQALEIRYRSTSTKEEEDEMYVFSASNRRVLIELLGKDMIQDKVSRFEELKSVSLSYLGISSSGSPSELSTTIPNLRELDLTGNLLSEWNDVGIICKELQDLVALNVSYNFMSRQITDMPLVKNIRILVLNKTGLKWMQVEILKISLPSIEELHLMGNKIKEITPISSFKVQGFDFLRVLNLEDNLISDWGEILKLSQIRSLEQLHLNKNAIDKIWYPEDESTEKNCKPFENLCGLLLGGNKISDSASVDALNSFRGLIDVRLSDNPVTDPGQNGLSRFVLIARLGKVEMLNGSEISPKERKDSEIRYVRQVMSKLDQNLVETTKLHPRFMKLKQFHGIEDQKPLNLGAGPRTMSSGLISITLKCVGASIGEKPPLTKKIPATITVGKLKNLCNTFFKLKSIKPILFLQVESSPLPTLLDDDMASLNDLGVCSESTILVDQDN